MTTATFTLPRETVVLDGGESTAPLPVARPEPLAPIKGRHRIDYRRFVDPVNARTVYDLGAPRVKRDMSIHVALVLLFLAVLTATTLAFLAVTLDPVVPVETPPAVISNDAPNPTRVPGGAR